VTITWRSVVFAAVLSMAGRAAAQDSGIKFEFHGFVGGSVYSEDASLSSGGGAGAWHVNANGDFRADKANFGSDVRQTRLNFSLTGPQIFANATPRAFAELDFFGNSGEGAFGDISITPRLRVAYAELKFAKSNTMVRVGQDHDLILGIILPATVGHVAFPLSYNAGGVGWRRPNVAVYQTFAVTSATKVEFAGSVGKANWRSGGIPGTDANPATPAFDPVDSRLVGLGVNSGLPAFQARAKVMNKMFEAFVSGYYSRFDLNGPGTGGGDHLDTTTATAGGKISQFGATLSAGGYYGKNLGPLAGNLLQWQPAAGVAEGLDVKEFGAWAQLGYNFTPTISAWALAGLSDPDDEDLIAAALTRTRNVTSSAMIRYQSKGYATGLEFSHFETKYTNLVDTQKGNQLMLSAMYFF
jgi:hypothetical protein